MKYLYFVLALFISCLMFVFLGLELAWAHFDRDGYVASFKSEFGYLKEFIREKYDGL